MSSANHRSYRYPGVRPFCVQDSDIFFGREEEIKRLHSLLMLEKVVVLFGKSGHGKTSLLNAGILPMLKQNANSTRGHYLPLEIRIGKVAGYEASILQKVISKVNEHLEDAPDWSFLEEFKPLPVFWHAFKKKQFNQTLKIILIFDQFEEFFTYSLKDQEQFRWELASLIYNRVPQSIRENVDEISDENYARLAAQMDIKVLFSLRSDRLSQLHSMKDAFPAILQYRFEIRALTVEQARYAITLPALRKDPKFSTHPFSYDDASLKIILDELVDVESGDSESIEAFHLQVICQACENVIERKLSDGVVDSEINVEDLPEFGNLYVEYYGRQLGKLPDNLRTAAQSVLENDLIFEDESTGECHRLSVDENILRRELSKLGVPDNILPLLESTFLIRRETNSLRRVSYEISHDTLIEPILKMKHDRKRKVKVEEIRRQAIEENEREKWKQLFWAAMIVLPLILAVFNWKYIYFVYVSFQDRSRPVVLLTEKLSEITSDMKVTILDSAKLINHSTMDAWSAAQLVTGLSGMLNDTLKRNFFELTSKSMFDTLCSWREMQAHKDFRASGWIVSAIAKFGLNEKYRCRPYEYLIAHQLIDGAWSATEIDLKLVAYGSTYSTCLVLRALHISLQTISDATIRERIETAIQRGVNWLMRNKENGSEALWCDYPKRPAGQYAVSKSLSALVIHTLNVVGFATSKINREWLASLKDSNDKLDIDFRELSDVVYRVSIEGALYRDLSRHLVIPWQIIATIDAYPYGDLSEKIGANIWLNNVIARLDRENIRKESAAFIKAEIYIALRYLNDKNYDFE